MPEPAPIMTKLARGRRLFSLVNADNQTLWLAGDCLLLQSSTGYTERVRRFYFADIQSIVYARTNAGTVITALCSVAAALLAFLGFWAVSDMGMTGGLLIAALALFPLAGLVFNIVAGPTCACMLSTAVHRERILALNRIPKVERVIGQILPLIDAAQGRLTGEMLGVDQPGADSVEAGRHAAGGGAGWNGLRPEAGTMQGGQGIQTAAAGQRGGDLVEAGRHSLEGNTGRVELRHEPGTFHRATFILCLVFAANHVVDIFVANKFYDAVIGNVLYVALIICALVAFRRQKNSMLPAAVKSLPVAVFVLVVLSLACSTCIHVYFMVLDPQHAMSGEAQFMMSRDSLVTQAYLVVGAMAYALAGIMGLMRLARQRTVFPSVESELAAPSTVRDESP